MSATSELYGELCRQATQSLQFLPDKPEETAETTVSALWFLAAGAPRSAAHSQQGPLPELDAAQQDALRGHLERRLSGVPLAHITGRQNFLGLEMLCGPQALVPRKETELLGRTAIGLAEEAVKRRGSAVVVDVCTGSGNVALAVAHHVATARVFGADLSEEAVEFARENARHLGLASRTEFRAGDLLVPFDTADFHGRVDVLTCNPPYISTAKVALMSGEIAAYEPHLAFDGGPFGVAILMRLLQEAPRFLVPGGWLAFELGLGQGPVLARRIEKSAVFSEVRTLVDDAGDVRAIMARL